ncbi:MAG: glycerate kinase [Verrucomicrobiota bacterium]
MRILVAFDKFKDSMTAPVACQAAARGARQALGDKIEVESAPLTDGGEGFCEILTTAAGGHLTKHSVSGPRGHPVSAPIGWVDSNSLSEGVHSMIPIDKGKIAIIEMASAAGLEQVPRSDRHPNHCTTLGVGQLIAIATEKKADAILLGIGGSATSDVGLGALEALGIQFIDTDGRAIEQIKPIDWPRVAGIKGVLVKGIPPIYIACDVDNPLLGPRGAAAVYGPQKGLAQNEITTFDTASGKVADLICEYFEQSVDLRDTPGSGAAGGIGFALKVACGADYIPGFDLVTAWIDLDAKIQRADCILSGEGKIDQSSLAGKGPIALAKSAEAQKKASLLFGGALEDGLMQRVREEFTRCEVFAISPKGLELEQALRDGAINLESKVAEILTQAYNDEH